jgi:hypothetical protein
MLVNVIYIIPPDAAEIDLVANNPGSTLLHRHRQPRIDNGSMQLL